MSLGWLEVCFVMLFVLLRSYVIFTAVVVLSERVEATVQKGFFRFLGTVIGGRSPTNPLLPSPLQLVLG